MPQAELNTPVVLIFFNRTDTTRQVFQRIAQMRPKQLFLIADAPRLDHPDDENLCAQARQVVQAVDWDCAVEHYYPPANMGIRNCISAGLDWVFSQVDAAIILEHDCLADPSFFNYCQELLQLYRHDQRIAMIGGTNYQFGRNPLPYSYYFSLYPHIWGWATWARAWMTHDAGMGRWPEARQRQLLKSVLPDDKALRFWTRRFDATYAGRIDTWDYGWTLSCWLENRLSIVPSVNLVSNIGFGKGAIHTTGRRSPYANMPAAEMKFPLVHPPYKIRYPAADLYTQRTLFRDHLLAPLKRKIKRMLGI